MARPRNNLGVGCAVPAQFGQGSASDVVEDAAFDANTITEFAENAREDAAVGVRLAGILADNNVCGGSRRVAQHLRCFCTQRQPEFNVLSTCLNPLHRQAVAVELVPRQRKDVGWPPLSDPS